MSLFFNYKFMRLFLLFNFELMRFEMQFQIKIKKNRFSCFSFCRCDVKKLKMGTENSVCKRRKLLISLDEMQFTIGIATFCLSFFVFQNFKMNFTNKKKTGTNNISIYKRQSFNPAIKAHVFQLKMNEWNWWSNFKTKSYCISRTEPHN